jgi:phospholipid/cholesterol/gamma-HCH transport system ATP-binding protein
VNERKIYARIENVGVNYGSKIVLHNLSLDIVEGAITCIIGLSGAGKSTILRLLNGLRRPDQGRVIVQGAEIGTLPESELIDVRRQIGFAFQFAALFDSLSVGDNVALPLREHTALSEEEIRKQVDATLESTGVDPIITHVLTELIIHLRSRLGGTAVVVSHDLASIFRMADYVAMLFEGAVVAYGTVEEIKQSANPVLQQFLLGSEVGPIPI